MTSEIGLMGLGVMGQNVALNIAEKGFSISVYNRTYSRTERTVERSLEEGEGKFKLSGFQSMADFVASLKTPRAIIILVKAGRPVDLTIDALIPLLDRGDLIIDGGNEWYENTERRATKVWDAKEILYMGMGVSGGELGARFGPSMMPGGPEEAYRRVETILERVSAKAGTGGDEPCVTYIGRGGAGNYVKMVHNGIEYGDMQLICEVYDIMKNVTGMTNEEMSHVFGDWNKVELGSYLIEITEKILLRHDWKPGQEEGYVIDQILDESGSKGTGMWTVQSAATHGVPVPTISAALFARYISAFREERVIASGILAGPETENVSEIDRDQLISDLKDALYMSKICSYAQGLALLRKASAEHDWALNVGGIAKIWRGGCIIRAVFLDRITEAYEKAPGRDLTNLLISEDFAAEVAARHQKLRNVVILAVKYGIPVPALSGSLAYYDSYRRARLPANMIQAQRDFFGSHTFKRLDDDEVHHVEWEE